MPRKQLHQVIMKQNSYGSSADYVIHIFHMVIKPFLMGVSLVQCPLKNREMNICCEKVILQANSISISYKLVGNVEFQVYI